jgi:hypothetical protein
VIETSTPVDRLRAFALPGGETALRGVRGVKLILRGEIRSAPTARWMPFTAEQTIEATRSAFRWDARLRTGPFHALALAVTDGYEPGLALHPSLEWTEIGPSTLRVRDLAEDPGVAVDFEIGSDGRPLSCRADRPRTVGKRAVITPWSGTFAEPREWEGLRVPTRLEAAWHAEDGPFTYAREETTSLTVLR